MRITCIVYTKAGFKTRIDKESTHTDSDLKAFHLIINDFPIRIHLSVKEQVQRFEKGYAHYYFDSITIKSRFKESENIVIHDYYCNSKVI